VWAFCRLGQKLIWLKERVSLVHVVMEQPLAEVEERNAGLPSRLINEYLQSRSEVFCELQVLQAKVGDHFDTSSNPPHF
jgi:hypothetical protein